MNVEEVYQLKRTFDAQGLILAYSGMISQPIIEEIGSALKNKIEQDEVSATVNNRLFAIFVEQVQNIMKYSFEKKLDEVSGSRLSTGIILVGYEKGSYFIMTGNQISPAEAESLKGRLEHLNTLSADELKSYYREERQKERNVISDSAGLGLIDIARKSSIPLDYKIEEISDKYSFFSIKATVKVL